MVVFEKDNAEDLAEKLHLVISDDELRRQIGFNAKNWVTENHSWDVISKRVIDVYQKLRRKTNDRTSNFEWLGQDLIL